METALVSLTAASTALVGTHFAMSHPLRAPLVRMLGIGGFIGVYSLVSLGCMIWMYVAFTTVQAAPPLWTAPGQAGQIFASVLTLIALVLFAGSMRGNPALPAPGAAEAATAEPSGVFLITRHPMMWGFALLSAAHIAAIPTTRTVIAASAIVVLALVGAHLQDRKKRLLMGQDWAIWESKTRFWPNWAALPRAGAASWLVGAVLWLVISWAHLPLHGVAVGAWHWLPIGR